MDSTVAGSCLGDARLQIKNLLRVILPWGVLQERGVHPKLGQNGEAWEAVEIQGRITSLQPNHSWASAG